jgi:hypothetical protein
VSAEKLLICINRTLQRTHFRTWCVRSQIAAAMSNTENIYINWSGNGAIMSHGKGQVFLTSPVNFKPNNMHTANSVNTDDNIWKVSSFRAGLLQVPCIHFQIF